MFMQFPSPALGPSGNLTVKGEVQDPSLPNPTATWIAVQSVEFGIENPTTIGSATGGAGAGKAKFNQFQIKKTVDSASPTLFSAVGLGVHFPTVTLVVRKAGGSKAIYLTYTFALVFVSEVDWSAELGDEAPTETVTLTYGAMGVSYSKQDSTGALVGSPAVSNWSQITNAPNLTVTP
jgi:type VI secretion system secreted protein Hcp